MRVSRHRETQANPQLILHNSYTGQNKHFFLLYFKALFESKDLERVKGIEPSS
jgi:hypothetical protein